MKNVRTSGVHTFPISFSRFYIRTMGYNYYNNNIFTTVPNPSESLSTFSHAGGPNVKVAADLIIIGV